MGRHGVYLFGCYGRGIHCGGRQRHDRRVGRLRRELRRARPCVREPRDIVAKVAALPVFVRVGENNVLRRLWRRIMERGSLRVKAIYNVLAFPILLFLAAVVNPIVLHASSNAKAVPAAASGAAIVAVFVVVVPLVARVAAAAIGAGGAAGAHTIISVTVL